MMLASLQLCLFIVAASMLWTPAFTTRPSMQLEASTVLHSSLMQGAPETEVLDPLTLQGRRSIASLVGKQCELLSKMSVQYWLDRGTLVGAARDGKIIPYDDDGDLSVLSRDMPQLLDQLPNASLPKGMNFKKQSRQNRPYVTFTMAGMHSDIVQLDLQDHILADPYHGDHESTNETRYGTLDRKLVNLDINHVLPTQECEFEGYTCQCPRDINAYLTSQYGSDWYLPLPWKDFSKENMKVYIEDVLKKPSKFLTDDMQEKLRAKLAEGLPNLPKLSSHTYSWQELTVLGLAVTIILTFSASFMYWMGTKTPWTGSDAAQSKEKQPNP